MSGSVAAAPAGSDSPSAGAAWRGDLGAGVTTGILAVPQGIAFALIAHVPPSHGLYAMIVPTIVAALVRSSPFLVTGATNTSALVIGALLVSLAVSPTEAVSTMLTITLLMGLIQVSCGALRLGSIGRYVSEAVLVGFTLGAATLIFADQLKNILGIHVSSSPRLFEALALVIPELHATDPRALTIAGVTVAILVGCARLSRLVPGAMIAIVATGLLVRALGWGDGEYPVALVGEIPRTPPVFTWPDLSVEKARTVLFPSFAIAILGMVEAISIGKALSAKIHVRFHADQELVAKGIGNVAGAFFGCLPTSASWTRSAINLQMGSKTRWVGVIAGLTVLVVMLLLAPWARYVPKACLGAIIAWIAWHMVDLSTARNLWRWSRADAAVLVVSYLSTLAFEIQYAIYFGVFVSLVLLVRRAATIHLVEMVWAGPRTFREIDIDEHTGSWPIVLLQLEGDLFFGIADELKESLEQIASRGARAIIIRMKRAHTIDASMAQALAAFTIEFSSSGGRLIFCGLKPELYEQIARSHLKEILGADNLLLTEKQVYGSMRLAMESVRREVEARGLYPAGRPLVRKAPPDSPEAWSFSI